MKTKSLLMLSICAALESVAATVELTTVGGDEITGNTKVVTGVSVAETDPTVPPWAKEPVPPISGVDAATATNIAEAVSTDVMTSTVTKAYVEGLGIEAGLRADAVSNIVSETILPLTNTETTVSEGWALWRSDQDQLSGDPIMLAGESGSEPIFMGHAFSAASADYIKGFDDSPDYYSSDIYYMSLMVDANTAGVTTNAANIATLYGLNDKIVPVLAAAAETNAAQSAALAVMETNCYTRAETDDAIDRLAAYYITLNAEGAAFPDLAALTNATVYYSGGEVRVPTRNDYAVVLADEAHGGAEWRYIFAVPSGASTGQWEAQYPIEVNDYEALSNRPAIDGNTLTENSTADGLGLLKSTAISAANPAFSNAVLSVGIGVDTNTVAAINAIVEAGDELPIGGATTVGALLLALAAAVASLRKNKADVSALRYDMGEVQTISTSQTDDTDPDYPITYAVAALADRTENRVNVTAVLDELHIAFPSAVDGKLRDFGFRVEIGDGTAMHPAPALVPVAHTGETVVLENPDGAMPKIADGTVPEKGVTLLYFSETAPGVFLVKGEQVQEVK